MTYCLFALLDNIQKTSIVWFDTFDNVFLFEFFYIVIDSVAS